MKITAIHDSARMLQAMLDGRKTQIRRGVAPKMAKHINFMGEGGEGEAATSDSVIFSYGKWADDRGKEQGPDWCVYSAEYPQEGCIPIGQCPYGNVGDLIWVREAFNLDFSAGIHYRDDGGSAKKAGYAHEPKWEAASKMPRWASRLTLEVTRIHLERLQEIAPSDCVAEGAFPAERVALGNGHAAIAAFQSLWLSRIGPRSWHANPWVWVIEFRVHRCNVDELLAKRGAL